LKAQSAKAGISRFGVFGGERLDGLWPALPLPVRFILSGEGGKISVFIHLFVFLPLHSSIQIGSGYSQPPRGKKGGGGQKFAIPRTRANHFS